MALSSEMILIPLILLGTSLNAYGEVKQCRQNYYAVDVAHQECLKVDLAVEKHPENLSENCRKEMLRLSRAFS